MKKSISKSINSVLNPCKYNIDISFSAFDVITGQQLSGYNILMDDKPITDYVVSTVNNDGTIRYSCQIQSVGPKKFTLTVDKENYYPFSREYTLSATSIYDQPMVEDLGRLPLLSEIKTNAIVLTWNQYPTDLDAKIINPDQTQTSVWNRQTFYSVVDIDDTASYGPETISFKKWVDWDSKYKVAGTFNYRVTWYKNGDDSVNNMGADVKLFLDPENPIDFNVRDALNGKNRLGADWVVFDLQYKSILGIHQTNPSSLITVDVPISQSVYVGPNNGQVRTDRNTHLKRIFNNYDFTYGVFDSSNNELPTSGYTVTKGDSSYTLSGTATNSSNKIKFYINQDFKDQNIQYVSFSGTSSISYTQFFASKLVPFMMYDKDGTLLNEVAYRYTSEYVYIDVKNRQYSVNNVAKYSYILGINDTHSYSEFVNTDDETPEDLNTYDAFLYQSTEQIKNVNFNFDTQNKTFNIIGNIFYDTFDFTYSLNDVNKFDIHLLPYNNNVKYYKLNEEQVPIVRTTYKIQGIDVLTTQKNAAVLKKSLITDKKQQMDVNLILKKVTNASTNQEIPFQSYSWDNNNLNIKFLQELQNTRCNFEFLGITMNIPRETLNIPKVRSQRPNIYLGNKNGDTFEQVSASYYYIWDADQVSLYFMEQPNLSSTNYWIKIIDYFKIYQFNVYQLNYFTKSIKINTSVWNYDDSYLDGLYTVYGQYPDNGGSYEIPGQKCPLYWESMNLYKFSQRYQKYLLDASICKSSYFGVQIPTNTNYSYYNAPITFSNQSISDIQGNADYKAFFTTKIVKNNKYQIVQLYSDGSLTTNEKPSGSPTVINEQDGQTITYSFLWPFVNFFGDIYDVNGNKYSNSYVRSINERAASWDYYYGYTKLFPKITYKVTLVNNDPSLSGDLTYQYACPNLDAKYGYMFNMSGFNYGNNAPHHQFMFKHSAFSNYNIGSYYGNGYNYNLESIYPGSYNFKINLYQIVHGANGTQWGYTSNDYAKYDTDTSQTYTINQNIQLTKDVQKTGSLYDYKIQIPLITVSGSVINEADNSLVYGQDLTVQFINKEDSTKSRKFVYDCFFGAWECYTRNWSKSYHNRLNQSFLFKLFGLERKWLPMETTNYMYEYYDESTIYPTDNDLKHHEPGIPSGIYDIKVYYKDIMFHEQENFEITKQKALNGQLSALVFKSPLINFNGTIVDDTNTTLSGQNWAVSIFDQDDNMIRNYRYKYSMNWNDMWYQSVDSSFDFSNLPLSSFFDYRHNNFEISWDQITQNPETEWSKERQTRWAIPSGTYNVKVKYKNKYLNSFPITFTKQNQKLGAYKDYKLNLGQVLKDFNIKFIDSQFNQAVQAINYGQDYRIYIRMYDQNFDGDITDDQFNGTNWGSDAIGSTYTFSKQFVGYYRLYFYCRCNNDTPEVLDVVDSQTEQSIYQRKQTTGAKYDLVNLNSTLVKSANTYNIILKNWWGGICFYYYLPKVNNDQSFVLNGSYTYTEFKHKNIQNLTYSTTGYSWPSIRPMKTGKYSMNAWFKFPDDTAPLKLFDQKEVQIRKYQDGLYYTAQLQTKQINLMFIAKLNDSDQNLHKVVGYQTIGNLLYSGSLSGATAQYYNSSSRSSNSNSKIMSFPRLMDNVYYSLSDIKTNNSSYSVNIRGIYTKEYTSEFGNDTVSASLLDSSQNILENGRFKVNNLQNGKTYIIVVDGYAVSFSFQVRDKNGTNSALNYSFYVYDNDGNLIGSNSQNSGSYSLSNVRAGKYTLKLCYQGMDITPAAFKNTPIECYKDMGTINVDLDFSLQTFSSTLLYPGPNNTLLSSYCDISVNVSKMTEYDGTVWDDDIQEYYAKQKELTYYFMDRGQNFRGSSNLDYPWTSTPNGMQLKQLMPGIYKIDILYRGYPGSYDDWYYSDTLPYFLTYDLRSRAGIFYYNTSSKPSFPIKVSKATLKSKIVTGSLIDDFKLVFCSEDLQYQANVNGNYTWGQRAKYSTGNLNVDTTSDPDYIIITKPDDYKLLYDQIKTSDNVYLYGYYFNLIFGQLLKSFYVVVNQNGIKIIDESQLSNYSTLKDQSTGFSKTTIGNIQLPYVYVRDYPITVSGYDDNLHRSTSTRMVMTDTTINKEIFNVDFQYYWGDWTTQINKDTKYYPSYFIVRSGHTHKFQYKRGNYVLGEVTKTLYSDGESISVSAVNIGSLQGTIMNTSLNRRVNHKINYWIYEQSDTGNEDFAKDTTLYYSGSIDASASGSFSFGSLFLNQRVKINLSEDSPSVSYPSAIKTISGNISENIEVPYEMYQLSLTYKSNKNDATTTIPASGFTIVRNNNDGYDETYYLTSTTNIKTGHYTDVVFSDTSKSIRYEYQDFTFDANRSFIFWHYCQTAYVTFLLGTSLNTLKIYDECGNLYFTKDANSSGSVGPLILSNITYKFENVDNNGNIIKTLTKKLINQNETIDLRS